MDWQAQYEKGELFWDRSAAHPAVLDYLAEAGPFSGRILVPGCGRGHEVRAISTLENRATGLDIAPAAVQSASAYPRAGNEEYIAGDLFNLEPELRGAFDWVLEHTCFCAIDPAMRENYVRGVASALKPGGRIFAIFYLQPAAETQPPYGVSTVELDAFFSPLFTLEKEWAPARTFEGRESRELVRLLSRKV